MPTVPPPFYVAWMPVFAAVITGILSALLTQFLTLKFGLKRFVKEKEVARRVEWHEKLFRTITLRQSTISQMLRATHEGDTDKALELIGLLNDNLSEMAFLLEESQIFASIASPKEVA